MHELSDLPIDPDVEVPQPPPPLRMLLRQHADLLPAIALGGATGSLARWAIARAVAGTTYPWATFAVNVGGCLLIGLLMAFVLEMRSQRRYLRPLVGVGFLGGLTTFSTFALDTRDLADSSHGLLALVYVVASVSLGLLAVTAGLLGGRAVVRRAR